MTFYVNIKSEEIEYYLHTTQHFVLKFLYLKAAARHLFFLFNPANPLILRIRVYFLIFCSFYYTIIRL